MSSTFVHFTTHRRSQLFIGFWPADVLRLYKSHYVLYPGADLRVSNRVAEIEDIHCFFGSYDLESCMTGTAERRVSFYPYPQCSLASWTFRFNSNRAKSSSRDCNRGLTSKSTVQGEWFCVDYSRARNKQVISDQSMIWVHRCGPESSAFPDWSMPSVTDNNVTNLISTLRGRMGWADAIFMAKVCVRQK